MKLSRRSFMKANAVAAAAAAAGLSVPGVARAVVGQHFAVFCFHHHNQLNAFPGCEVAVSDAPSGQLIVVVEAEDSETLIQTIESVRNVEGVLAVSLVYHQQEEQGEETP